MLLEEKMGDLHYQRVSKTFLSRTQNIKKNIDKLGYTKIRNFCSSKDTINKASHRMGEGICLLDKGLTSRIYV